MPHFDRIYHPPGTPPGTYDVAHVRGAAQPTVTVVDYSTHQLEVGHGLPAIETAMLPGPSVRWINIAGTPSLDVLTQLESRYDIDALVLEDMVNVGQRPKFNEYENGLFVSLVIAEDSETLRFRQLSIFLQENRVISVTDANPELFEPLLARLRGGSTLLRSGDARFLLYGLLDLSVDLMFPVAETRGEHLGTVEAQVLSDPGRQVLPEIHELRSQLMFLRKNAWATREVAGQLIRHDEGAPPGETSIRPYLEDCHDHLVGLIDLIENQREIAAGLVEIHLSMTSNRMNETIRVLTIMATLFIPATFIVGVYGMNFDRTAGPWSMPELGWPFGYVLVLVVIGMTMAGMLVYFRLKRWL